MRKDLTKCVKKCSGNRRHVSYDINKLPESLQTRLHEITKTVVNTYRCSYCGVVWVEVGDTEIIIGRQDLGGSETKWDTEALSSIDS